METVSGESGSNFADRGLLISKTILCQTAWEKKPCGEKPNNDDRTCIIATGFNGGALCIFNWMYQYGDYLRSISPPNTEIHKSEDVRIKVCFGNQSSGYSEHAIIYRFG